METKQNIRKQIFALRKEITEKEVAEKSRQITDRILSLPEFRDAEILLAYADYNHEAMTRYLIQEAWQRGKRTAVPKVFGKQMIFYEISDFSSLAPGYFGIPEPVDMPEAHWDHGLMIMPGVAFDPALHRVGYGGGFYDRFLAEHPELVRIAIAFDFQVLPEVPSEETDLSPDLLVTESQILRAKS